MMLLEKQKVLTELFFSTTIHHTCRGRTTCALRVRWDVKAEAQGAASLRHLEGEETLEKVRAGLHACQHLIGSPYTLQQSESHTQNIHNSGKQSTELKCT